MRQIRSPWLHQLRKDRAPVTLHADTETDVAVIGAGIAGVSTAFFALKYTKQRVAVFERHLLAHGATGHNGGQAVTYFERGFASLCEEFGVKLAGQGQHDVESAWQLLDEIYTDAGLGIFFTRFTGHAGLANHAQVLYALKNNHFKKQAGLLPDPVRIAATASYAHDIPHEYAGLYRTVPQSEICQLLETKSAEYEAMVSEQKGVLNSALFCERVVEYLLKKYPKRFSLYEHAPVDKLVLRQDHAVLDIGKHTAKAARVVLCTNGFENIRIFNESGLDIDARFHHTLEGKVGYMSGYLEKLNKQPIALSYYNQQGYGPETNCKIEYVFTWHGLMGYTRNKVRMVGEEPQNPVLLYNLGCNGVGLLPSIFGGRKIARHLAGEAVPKSIFDIPRR